MKTHLGAMESALAGLFDYAGIFPPAGLDLRMAVRNYLEYQQGRHAWALGCMVIDEHGLSALQEAAEDETYNLRLSAITTDMDLAPVSRYIEKKLPIAMVEVKAADRGAILRSKEDFPAGVAVYVEVPMGLTDSGMLDAMDQAGMRAKLRMGGVVAEAFPTAESVTAALKTLAERRMAFKATAGLHHPLRSRHPFTYQPDSKVGMMHGFMNLVCAAALVWFGGEADEAARLLEERDSRAWQVEHEAIRWRSREWSTEQLREVRERFLISIGSCSFSEPISDLEALGWL